MGEQAALAYDPQGLERLLVSRENVGDVDGKPASFRSPSSHLARSNHCLDHPTASYFPFARQSAIMLNIRALDQLAKPGTLRPGIAWKIEPDGDPFRQKSTNVGRESVLQRGRAFR